VGEYIAFCSFVSETNECRTFGITKYPCVVWDSEGKGSARSYMKTTSSSRPCWH